MTQLINVDDPLAFAAAGLSLFLLGLAVGSLLWAPL